MRYLKLLAVLAAAALASVACKSQYDLLLEGNDTDAKYKAAFEYFENGKYQKSATLFESLAMVTQGTERDDTVQYYWGLSNYSDKDFVTAEANFDRFITNFPRSPFAESAKFLRIDCMYKSTFRYELDQTPTYKALTAMNEYLIEHPTGMNADVIRQMVKDLGERLDKKAFENARLYYKMEDYKAATVAFRNVLKDDSDNIYREDILYYIAQSSHKYASLSYPEKQKERFLVFVDDYLNFIGEFPESGYRRELDGMYRRVQRFLGKYPTVIPAEEEEPEEQNEKN